MSKVIQLAYGEAGLPLELDEKVFDVTTFSPQDISGLADEKGAFDEAMVNPIGTKPLKELTAHLNATSKVVIVIADHTRPVPDGKLIPWLVDAVGLPDSCFTILIGTGTHRGSTQEEIETKLGKEIAARFKIVNHHCIANDDLQFLGATSCGGKAYLHKLYCEADFKIATGFIEPHFFAGFSGGVKGVCPGVAGQQTILHFHRAKLLADPRTTWGKIENNPLQAMAREVVALLPPDFIVNVTLNLRREITGIFAGDVIAAHEKGCERALEEATVQAPHAYPVVVVTNSGYPLDQNFYQAVKGISAASRIVEQGGVIIIACECRNGLPDEGDFKSILQSPLTSGELLEQIMTREKTVQDQWQVQILLMCLQKSRIFLYTSLPDETMALTRVERTKDIAATLEQIRKERGAKKLRVAVMPMGPLTIPLLSD